MNGDVINERVHQGRWGGWGGQWDKEIILGSVEFAGGISGLSYAVAGLVWGSGQQSYVAHQLWKVGRTEKLQFTCSFYFIYCDMTWSFQDTNLRDICGPRPIALVITFWNQEDFEEDKDLTNDGAEVDTGSYNRQRLGHFSPGMTLGLSQHSHS